MQSSHKINQKQLSQLGLISVLFKIGYGIFFKQSSSGFLCLSNTSYFIKLSKGGLKGGTIFFSINWFH